MPASRQAAQVLAPAACRLHARDPPEARLLSVRLAVASPWAAAWWSVSEWVVEWLAARVE
jgi:hypothetical protein